MHELIFKSETPIVKKRGNLIQFRGRGDDYCAYMEPLKERLRQETGMEISCYEVWHDPKNLELFNKLDRGRYAPRFRAAPATRHPLGSAEPCLSVRRCKGVPFFYNKKTKRYICGATTYGNLRAWAEGERCESNCPPPYLKAPGPPEEEGAGNVFGQFIDSVKAKGKEVVDGRGKDDEEEEGA